MSVRACTIDGAPSWKMCCGSQAACAIEKSPPWPPNTTNNTPQVIDSNQFVGDIYIKPARAINFIQLNFVAVRTGVDFTEVVGKF